jgi:hypothetical protein
MQLKAKKRGIEALEEMLREASKSSDKPRRRRRRESAEEADPELRSAPGIVKYFVCGFDGLFIEFVSKSTMTIGELKRELRNQLFKGGRRDKPDAAPQDSAIRLTHNGRILADDLTLFDNKIKDGDTLIMLDPSGGRQEALGSVRSGGGGDEGVNQMMLGLIGQQQESIRAMTAEMR